MTPPGAQVAFNGSAELSEISRETGGDSRVERLHIQVLNDGLLGQTESIRRIRPGDKGIGIAGFGTLDNRREILGAERVGFIIDNFKTGLFKEGPGRAGQLDAKCIGHVDHGDLVADLSVGSHL